MRGRQTLTTGMIAAICEVSPMTVIRWISSGKLKAHQFPGTGGHRRVKTEDFIDFLKENDLPIPEEFQSRSNRVLIVEDEFIVAAAIEETLRTAGLETCIASSGFEAGRFVETFKPDVMTLDLKMPGMSGLEVLRSLHNAEHRKDVKVLVVSAMPREMIDEALEAGADDAIEKPYDESDLVERVMGLVGAQQVHSAEHIGAYLS